MRSGYYSKSFSCIQVESRYMEKSQSQRLNRDRRALDPSGLPAWSPSRNDRIHLGDIMTGDVPEEDRGMDSSRLASGVDKAATMEKPAENAVQSMRVSSSVDRTSRITVSM